ncbi:UTP--glucose-1-phosphate uridylyltransferase [Bacillus sp. FJAT-45350]|uniref:UTP--glucose-1-phosphate uridylyltransferase n=1 Tax=Bacillus sp. FJAT-45350 TaxID=2011014 RepID=UPI000BB6B3DB|nr:UTP--glucose-1-phosphate uridylyltransferase [Bacillus sp. FJAT-45350]
MVKKAIIPAAGYGTRNLPITKVLPKEMFPIGGRPAIDYIIEEAEKAGITEVLIILSRTKTMIMDYYDRSLELESFLHSNNKSHLLEKVKLPNVHIQYVRQPYARGLGDAIKLAKAFVGNEPFAVLLPDEILLTEKEPALTDLIKVYDKYDGNVIGVQKEEESNLKNYGVINGQTIDKCLYQLLDIVEKPQNNPPSNMAVIGRYILKAKIFDYLEKQQIGVNGELQLTDALREMSKVEKAYGLELVGERFDIAKKEDYLKLLNLKSNIE